MNKSLDQNSCFISQFGCLRGRARLAAADWWAGRAQLFFHSHQKSEGGIFELGRAQRVPVLAQAASKKFDHMARKNHPVPVEPAGRSGAEGDHSDTMASR